MLSNLDFKEKLARYCGRDWVELQNGKFAIPCPGTHMSTPQFGHTNLIVSPTTQQSIQCEWCKTVFNSAEDLLAALEANYKSEVEKYYGVAHPEKKVYIPPTHQKNSGERDDGLKDFTANILRVGDILSQEFSEVTWLVNRMIPAPGIMALSGMPGDFKSFITLHMALSVARGTPVFGKFAAQKGGVLIIDEENHLRYVKKRLQLLGATADDPIYYLSLSGFKVDDEDMVAAVLKIAKEKNIILIALDSFVDIHNQEENDAGGTSKVFQGIKQFLAADISVISIHHHRKMSRTMPNNPAQSLRGSSNILAAVDSHISVERKQDDDILVLRHNKSRHAEALVPIEVKILKNEADPREPIGFEFVGTLDEKKRKAEDAAEAIEELLQEGIKSRSDIEASLSGEFGKGAVSDGLKLSEKNGKIEKVPKNELPDELKKESRKHFYRLISLSESEEEGDDELPSLF